MSSSTYIVRAGDTLTTIARRVYGDDQYAANIARANPGLTEPLLSGTVLSVPFIQGAPIDRRANAPTSTLNEVAVLIDGRRFRYWSETVIERSIDSIDSITLSAPFDGSMAAYREVFRPFSFRSLVVSVGGETLFTGVMVGVDPVLGDSNTIQISGYATPGVLNDCTPPVSSDQLEFDETTLAKVARALCEPFGIEPRFTASSGAAFERVAIKPDERVLPFLSDLARQRNFVVSSAPDGALLFQRSVAQAVPVATLEQGFSPVVSVSARFNPQQYHSSITGLESVLFGTDGAQYTVKNPHLNGVVRPLTFGSPDVEGGDLSVAVAAKIGRMFANAVEYSLDVNTWRDASGSLWAPNTTLQLSAPSVMIYSPYTFLIRSVRFNRNAESETATLSLVLPGAFSGEIPESMPWDE